MKRRQVMVLLLIVVIAGSAFYYVNSRYPSARGMSLNEWIEVYSEARFGREKVQPNHHAADEAIAAIREMGNPAVKRLTDKLETRDSRSMLVLHDLSRRQSLIDIPFEPASSKRHVPAEILCDLGVVVSNSVPRLVRMLDDPELGPDAARVLAAVGHASLDPLIGSMKSQNVLARSLAAQALGWMGTNAAPAMPELVELMRDTNRVVRSAVIRSLGAIGTSKPEMEQMLTRLLHSADAGDAACGLMNFESNCVLIFTRSLTNSSRATLAASITALQSWRDRKRYAALPNHPRTQRYLKQRERAAFNLKALGTDLILQRNVSTAYVARTLLPNLNEPDSRVRELSADMLSGFPSEAKLIRPALQKASGDSDALVRAAARRSLERLTSASGASGLESQ